MCGFKRPAVSATQPLSVAPDVSVIDSRLDQLRGIAFSSTYAKQRDSLKKEFSAFLGYLPGSKTIFSATPKCLSISCVERFSRKNTGPCYHLSLPRKTKVHSCGCPVRLFYATVDSCIGKLRAIFKEAGMDGDCDSALGFGNPAASVEVKAYLRPSRLSSCKLLLLPSIRRHSSSSKSFSCPVLFRGKC